MAKKASTRSVADLKKKTGKAAAEAAPSSQKSSEQLLIEMADFDWEWVQVTLTGTTPLLTNAFSEAKQDAMERDLVEPPLRKGRGGPKKARDPEAEFRLACHICHGTYGDGFLDSRFGMSAIGLKKAFARGAKEFAGAVMADMIRFTFFHGEYQGIIPIHVPGKPDTPAVPTRVRHAVPNNKGQCTLVYRPEFDPWAVTVPVRFCTNKMTLAQLLNVLRAAGQICGWGSFRHENGGIYGLWEVESEVIGLGKGYRPRFSPVIIS